LKHRLGNTNAVQAAVVSSDNTFINRVAGSTINGTTYVGHRARTTGLPKHHLATVRNACTCHPLMYLLVVCVVKTRVWPQQGPSSWARPPRPPGPQLADARFWARCSRMSACDVALLQMVPSQAHRNSTGSALPATREAGVSTQSRLFSKCGRATARWWTTTGRCRRAGPCRPPRKRRSARVTVAQRHRVAAQRRRHEQQKQLRFCEEPAAGSTMPPAQRALGECWAKSGGYFPGTRQLSPPPVPARE